MTQAKSLFTDYYPYTQKSRFWIYAENCYTESEINFREWILNIRKNSGIHAEYLATACSWFSEDDEQAYLNPYKNSWFFSSAFVPRCKLSRKDFYVRAVDTERLQWPQLYDLMQQIGDYLLIRNSKLIDEHLNQPMNYVLIDINQMLHKISQNPILEQTQEQLRLLVRYIRTIESALSLVAGSDRLFIAHLRTAIENHVKPQLNQINEAQILKNELDNLVKIIKQLSTERHRILHFALNTNIVNPHSYDFNDYPNTNTHAYPIAAVFNCYNRLLSPASLHTFKKLTPNDLRNCLELRLLSSNHDVLKNYADAINDLNELMIYKKAIVEISNLLVQVGQFYTLYQYKNALSLLLNQIIDFVDKSTQPINFIIDTNSRIYLEALYNQQKNLFFNNWFFRRNDPQINFIANQNILAQFPSTKLDMLKTKHHFQTTAEHIKHHIESFIIQKNDLSPLSEQAISLNQLLKQIIPSLTDSNTLENSLSLPKKIPNATPFTKNSAPLFFENDCSLSKQEVLVHSQNNHVPYLLMCFIAIPIGVIVLFLISILKRKEPLFSDKKINTILK